MDIEMAAAPVFAVGRVTVGTTDDCVDTPITPTSQESPRVAHNNMSIIEAWVACNARNPAVAAEPFEQEGALVKLPVGKTLSINLLTNYNVLWNMLSESDGDVFGDFAPFFQISTAFYFHRTTFAIMFGLGIYLMTLSIITVITADHNSSAAVANVINESGILPSLVSFTLFYVLYRIMRGDAGRSDGVLVSRRGTVGGIGQGDFDEDESENGLGSKSEQSETQVGTNPLLRSVTAGSESGGWAPSESRFVMRESVDDLRRRHRVAAAQAQAGERSYNRYMEAEKTWAQLGRTLVTGNLRRWRRMFCFCIGRRASSRRSRNKSKSNASDNAGSPTAADDPTERVDHDEDEETDTDSSDDAEGAVLGLYQLLNLAAKFLLVHGRSASECAPSPNIQIVMVLFMLVALGSMLQWMAVVYFYVAFCMGNVTISEVVTYNTTVYNATLQANVTTVVTTTDTQPYFDNEFCTHAVGGFYLTAAYLFVAVFRTIVSGGLAVGLSCIGYGTDLCHKMSDHFSDRIAALRLLTPEDEEEGERELADLIPLLRTDAIECYLFRQKLIKTLSVSFQNFLLVYILCSVVSMAGTVASQLITPLPLPQFVILVCIECLYLCYPLLCVAHANYAAEKMRARIFLSSPSDYSALGSREKWVAYLGENSTTWNIYGLPITYNLLVAAASSGLAAIMVYMYHRSVGARVGGDDFRDKNFNIQFNPGFPLQSW